MSMLGFLPWIALDSDLQLGRFRFTPYLRGRAPFGVDTAAQRTADLLLEPCRGLSDRPIGNAVVVQVAGREPFDELPDEESQMIFEAVELLAFSALARRDFFNFNTGAYCNRDHFALYLQQFQDPTSGARVVTRRRDGVTTNLLPREAYRVRAPEHAQPHQPRIDERLLMSLWSVRERAPEWPHYFEAILSFNQANTDNQQVSEQAEAVAMVGAFERLYDLMRGREDQLLTAVIPDLAWYGQLDCDTCRRDRTPAQRVGVPTGPTAEWLRDFSAVAAGGRMADEIRHTPRSGPGWNTSCWAPTSFRSSRRANSVGTSASRPITTMNLGSASSIAWSASPIFSGRRTTRTTLVTFSGVTQP